MARLYKCFGGKGKTVIITSNLLGRILSLGSFQKAELGKA
jgi:hypothetical protein